MSGWDFPDDLAGGRRLLNTAELEIVRVQSSGIRVAVDRKSDAA